MASTDRTPCSRMLRRRRRPGAVAGAGSPLGYSVESLARLLRLDEFPEHRAGRNLWRASADLRSLLPVGSGDGHEPTLGLHLASVDTSVYHYTDFAHRALQFQLRDCRRDLVPARVIA